MRTLKKTLCLVLALVMMLGLCAINVAATDLPDDEKIGNDYREAFEVITGIGVITGKEEGGQVIADPQGTLTRVQGCYYVSRMLQANLPDVTTSQFSDVSGQDAAVVEWMVNNGYASGNGDGTFDPYGTMLGMHFAKWLLTALGYNAETEKMTGAGDKWEGNVRILTAKEGLSRGIEDYDQNAAITREEAAQMCLNTLKQPMRYYPNGGVVSEGGTTVGVDLTAQIVKNNSGTGYLVAGNDPDMQFVEMYFPKLKLDNTTGDTSEEDLNTPLDGIWNYNGKELYKVLAAPVAVYTGSATAGAVASDLAGYYILEEDGDDDVRANHIAINNAVRYDNNTQKKTEQIVTVNGATQASLSVSEGSADDYFTVGANKITIDSAKGSTLAGAIAGLTKNGRVVELYATDNDHPQKITKIVVTCYTVAKVDSITTSGAKTTYEFVGATTKGDVGVSAVAYSDAPDNSTLHTNATLAKGDIVTITTSDKNKALDSADNLFVYAADKYTGVQTDFDQRGHVTIDGKTYNVAEGVAKKDAYASNVLLTSAGDFKENDKEEVEFYLDQYGYLVLSNAITKTANYAFIVAAEGKKGSTLNENKPEISVRAVLVSDGKATVDTYTVKVEKKSPNDLNKENDKIPSIYAPATSDAYTTATNNGSAIGSVGVDDKLWVIANTGIVAGYVDDEKLPVSGWGAADSSVCENGAAQILMSNAYGYVYTYTLNDKELTLTPMTSGYNLGTAAEDTKYAGQTTTRVVSGKQNYGTAVNAVSGTADVKKYTKPQETPSNTNPATTELVVSASTPVIIYKNSDYSAEVRTGVGSLPGADKIASESGAGYFVAEGTGKASMNAKILFVYTNDGLTSSTSDKTVVYISDSNYKTIGTGDDKYREYDAWKEDGSASIKVRDGVKGGVPNVSELGEGLYEIDADGNVMKTLYTGNSSPDANTIKAATPYYFIAEETDPEKPHISGDNLIDTDPDKAEVTGTHSWNTATARTVVVKEGGKVNFDKLFLVLEVSNSNLTGNVKTIFVV